MVLLFLEDWWGLLSSTEKVFWGISLVFSVLFLIQFVVSLIGLNFNTDSDAGVHVESNGEYHLDPSFTILSVRSIISFFTFFGWTGVFVLKSGGGVWTVIGFAGFHTLRNSASAPMEQMAATTLTSQGPW